MSKQTLYALEEDDRKIGIMLVASNLEDYRLAYTLNKFCTTNFVCVSEFPRSLKNMTNSSFSFFFSLANSTLSSCYLVNNQMLVKSTQPILDNLFERPDSHVLPMLKGFAKWPYFLLFPLEWLTEWNEILAHIRTITATQIIDFQSLPKSDKNIIYTIYNED